MAAIETLIDKMVNKFSTIVETQIKAMKEAFDTKFDAMQNEIFLLKKENDELQKKCLSLEQSDQAHFNSIKSIKGHLVEIRTNTIKMQQEQFKSKVVVVSSTTSPDLKLSSTTKVKIFVGI